MKIYEVTWSCRIVGACAWLGNRPRSRYVKVQGFRNQDFSISPVTRIATPTPGPRPRPPRRAKPAHRVPVTARARPAGE